MSKITRTGSVTGKITASPNPVYFGQGDVLISWETNDPGGVEVRVSTQKGGEKLVSKSNNQSGGAKIPWIVDSTGYEFRLYAASQPGVPIDSVTVRRSIDSVPVALREIAEEVARGNIDVMQVSQFIADVVSHCLKRKEFHQIFQIWERKGFHVTRTHFYQPIPNTQDLRKALWDKPGALVGLDMNDSVQLDLLREHFPKFRNEYEQFPTEPGEKPPRFHLGNRLFDGLDALVGYCMIRHFQPRLIVEVGGGYSTLLLTEAAAKNNTSALICIEPFPQEFLKEGIPGLQCLIEKKVQDIDLEFFSQLQAGDVLFIDSSHTVKIGGDVNFLFLEVLPRLSPGVIVHVHDIFLPFEYPSDWVVGEFRFWSEQYLLQAFLAFNSEFEVLMTSNYLANNYLEEVKAAFPTLEKMKRRSANSARWGGGSFWMRRKLLPENRYD